MDAFCTLRHVTVRGIEKRRIVDDNADRKNIVNRLCRTRGTSILFFYLNPIDDLINKRDAF